jgi:hypothetical protein
MIRILAAMLLIPAAAQAEVYKCPGSDGRLGFSDRPCQATGLPHSQQEAIEIKKPNGGLVGPPKDWVEFMDRRDGVHHGGQSTGRRQDTGPCKQFNSSELRRMKIQNTVVPGMTAGDAMSAWGSPTRINGSQYVYRWDDTRASYFYVESGCVYSVDGGYGRKY